MVFAAEIRILQGVFLGTLGVLASGCATIEEGVREGAILAPQQGITHAPDGTSTALVAGVQRVKAGTEVAVRERVSVYRDPTQDSKAALAGSRRCAFVPAWATT